MKIKKMIFLKEYSTFKIGGPAKYFVEVETLKDLRRSIEWAKKEKEKYMILGGGSNILFHDKGFNGLVIRLVNNKIDLIPKTIVSVEAGATLNSVVSFSVKNNLTGLEWAAGIPGTVGGAVRGNAGAFGLEMKDIIKEVIYLNLENLKEGKCDIQECQFDYRKSVFKEFDQKIVWKVLFDLKLAEEKKDCEKLVKDIIKKRQEKHPHLSEAGSIGSIFKNPIVKEDVIKLFEKEKGIKCKGNQVPAGWLIDMCGLRGHRIDGAQISDKQANFILNVDNASSDTIVILISLIKQKVRNTFGIQLQEEVEIVGY